MAVGDFNNDESPDLAVTSYTNSRVDILTGNGDGTLQDFTSYDTGLDPLGVAAADLDLDGYTDLAVVSWGDDAVSIMLNDGDGGLTLVSEPSVGSSPRSIVIDDFDGDGRSDLAVSNSGSDSASVLLGTGPRASDYSTMINENATMKFSQALFADNFINYPFAPALQQVTILSLPSHGTLNLQKVPVTENQAIPANQLKYLSYTIDQDYAGSDSFDWRGSDGTANSTSATVLFTTTPEATITAGANAVEGGSASNFTIILNHASLNDVIIKLSASGKAVAGKNYVRLPKSITIPAGHTAAPVALTPIVDGVAKGDLAVIAKISTAKGYTPGPAKSATITIIDDEPKISITADTNTTSLGGAHGVITFTRTGDTGEALTLTIKVKGTAKAGKDYTKLPVTVTIDSGHSSVSIDVVALLNVAKTKTVQVSAKATKDFSLDLLESSAIVQLLHV
jgi:hypothetical protein